MTAAPTTATVAPCRRDHADVIPRRRRVQRGGLHGGGPGRTTPPRARRTPRVPLRITLVALLVALVAVGLGATGFAATSLLRGYLIDQQDDAAPRARCSSVQQRPVAAVSAPARPTPSGCPARSYFACLPPDGDHARSSSRGPCARRRLPAARRRRRSQGADGTAVTPCPGRTAAPTWRVMTGAAARAATPSSWRSTSPRTPETIGRLVALEVVVGLIVLAVLAAPATCWSATACARWPTSSAPPGPSPPATSPSACPPATTGPRSAGCRRAQRHARPHRVAFRAQQASEEQARASEDRMRRFVADASHELRTPLTSIRGFAELYRQGAVRTPEETRRLMQRIESEGARMGLLVEDLLQLARLDQQRPLTIVPVDLAEIAGDAVHDARAVQPDRPISPAPGRVAHRRPGRARRRGPAAPGGRQPGHQRAHPHPARRRGSPSRSPRTRTTPTPWCCGSPTRARAWPRTTPSGCSSGSTGPTRPAPARPAAPASGLAIVASLVAAHGGTRRPADRPGAGRRLHRPAAPLRAAVGRPGPACEHEE